MTKAVKKKFPGPYHMFTQKQVDVLDKFAVTIDGIVDHHLDMAVQLHEAGHCKLPTMSHMGHPSIVRCLHYCNDLARAHADYVREMNRQGVWRPKNKEQAEKLEIIAKAFRFTVDYDEYILEKE